MSRRAAGAVLGWLLAVGPLAATPAWGQTVIMPGRDSFWFGAGLGAGSEDFAASLNGSYQFGASVVSLRTTVTAGLFEDGFNDYAVLYGRATRPSGKRYQLSAAAGIGLVDGCRGGGIFSSCRDISTVVGLPLEVQAYWRPGKFLGFGLYGFANLNRAQSFAGLTLGLQGGRLR